jgi:GDPmannose 4,6-dehydratase
VSRQSTIPQYQIDRQPTTDHRPPITVCRPRAPRRNVQRPDPVRLTSRPIASHHSHCVLSKNYFVKQHIAFITGITGQDGSYLAENLLEKGYEVHGLVRRASMFNRSRIDHLRNNKSATREMLSLHYGDLNDSTSIRRILQKIKPTEIYHLAGQSHVGLSFDMPEVTCQDIANATLALLEIVRDLGTSIRFYNAASSEIFGDPDCVLQDEQTPMRPKSPYGCAKAFAVNLCQVYRDVHGMYICNGIAFNHESPRRGENFVTKKISMGVAKIKLGIQSNLILGSLDSSRDWGYAPEYVECMTRALKQGTADDYIIATGTTHTVRDFVAAAFEHVGLDWSSYVVLDPRYARPQETHKNTHFCGNPVKARVKLGWKAEKSFTDLVKLMVDADLNELSQAQNKPTKTELRTQ